MSNKTILTIDDLMQPFQLLHMADKHGRAVNMAEMLVESRDVNGRVYIDCPDKHFSGDRDFNGKLSCGTEVRARVLARLVGPFDKMSEENWGTHLNENIWKKGDEGDYPDKGDIMSVYWLSKDGKLPKAYSRVVRYVNPCGYELPFSRNYPEGKHEFIFRGLDTDQGQYWARIRSFIKLIYDDSRSIARIPKDSDNYSIFMKYLNKKAFPDNIESLSNPELIFYIREEYGNNMKKILEENKNRIADYHSLLIELLRVKYYIADIVKVERKDNRFDCFARISSSFCGEFIFEFNSMLRRKKDGPKVSSEDSRYLIYTSFQGSISPAFKVSVTAKYGHFGGGERRRVKGYP